MGPGLQLEGSWNGPISTTGWPCVKASSKNATARVEPVAVLITTIFADGKLNQCTVVSQTLLYFA